MSKKEEEKVEELKLEVETPKKEEEKKSTSKKKDKKKTDKMAEKFTLLELVSKHKDVEDLFFKLSMYGFINQYREEKTLADKGGYIEPTVTEKEFEKVIK